MHDENNHPWDSCNKQGWLFSSCINGSSQDAGKNARFQKRFSPNTGRKGMFFIEKWIFSQNGAYLKSIFFTPKNASGSVLLSLKMLKKK